MKATKTQLSDIKLLVETKKTPARSILGKFMYLVGQGTRLKDLTQEQAQTLIKQLETLPWPEEEVMPVGKVSRQVYEARQRHKEYLKERPRKKTFLDLQGKE